MVFIDQRNVIYIRTIKNAYNMSDLLVKKCKQWYTTVIFVYPDNSAIIYINEHYTTIPITCY